MFLAGSHGVPRGTIRDKSLSWRRRIRSTICSSKEHQEQHSEDDELLRGMQEDLRRMDAPASFQADQSSSFTDKDSRIPLREVVDKALIVDFFFIVVALGWLLAGLGEKAAFNSSTLLDSWYPLWPLLFQPALGFFMAGVLLSVVFPRKENK
ncbi:uncharacterized protein LOC112343683 [Selaginella moellendorffii]|uniref:uncharacterized protein LOC112343683 n=1 Tax=Selaginella moellendorffii TaxID=88036 RepID=UPI000D1C2CF4|nr:uncharacterized protein LOC112343683 [Selaginella moellendorffii]|eukprot:XP_024523347.1 uncharacterized protein LOC112343683 [Selaginella moellendorffii]